MPARALSEARGSLPRSEAPVPDRPMWHNATHSTSRSKSHEVARVASREVGISGTFRHRLPCGDKNPKTLKYNQFRLSMKLASSLRCEMDVPGLVRAGGRSLENPPRRPSPGRPRGGPLFGRRALRSSAAILAKSLTVSLACKSRCRVLGSRTRHRSSCPMRGPTYRINTTPRLMVPWGVHSLTKYMPVVMWPSCISPRYSPDSSSPSK